MEIGGVDYVADSFNAFYEFAKVGHHILPFDDLGIAGKGRWQKSLVHQWLKAHHDGMVCNTHTEQ